MSAFQPHATYQPDRPSGGPVEQQLAALKDMNLKTLRDLWKTLYRQPAPKFFRREILIRGLGYQIQAKAYGDLSPRTRKRLLKIAARHEAGEGFTTADAPRKLPAGTRLVRAWKGTTHTVNVLSDGFEWNGTRYRSLSAVAREISGTNWNGLTFFGLKRGGDNG